MSVPCFPLSQFTVADEVLLVVEASCLGLPPGQAHRTFQVTDDNALTIYHLDKVRPDGWHYISEDGKSKVHVLND